MPVHNKLVRDKIPEIIEKSGKTAHCRILNDEEYLTELDRKLNEECAEYQADKTIEELADMLEVMYAIAEARGYSVSELERVRAEKAEKRGDFKDCIYLEWAEDLNSEYGNKIKAYYELINDVRNCPKLADCNKSCKVQLQKCEFCNEINLWSYWQGGINNLNAKILVVGQDWGTYNYGSDATIEYIKSKDNNSDNRYMDNNQSETDNNLCQLFEHIGYDIRNEDCSDLFFTNFVLCYREKGLSGGFERKWADNCSDYFVRLVKIIQPKIIICLGKNVYNGVMRSFGKKIPVENFNKVIENGKRTLRIDGIDSDVHIFPMAHCGNLGTYNRNDGMKTKYDDKLYLQKRDWEAIKEVL